MWDRGEVRGGGSIANPLLRGGGTFTMQEEGAAMKKQPISALVVSAQGEHSQSLERALNNQSIHPLRAGSCEEARGFLQKAKPPHLLFTDTTLPDGTWADLLSLAREARQPVNVVVVSRVDDVGLYLETMQQGAFDFISAPFPASDLAHVVQCASTDVSRRRQAA
jgi:DNA-binding NtrC family response regulator